MPARSQPAPKNPLVRYQQGRKVVALRSRAKPASWEAIAKDLGMSRPTVRALYDQALTWDANLKDPLAVLDETVDVFTVAMQGMLETFAAAAPDSGVRVRAMHTAMEAADRRLQILRQAGRAPRSLEGPSVAAQMQVVFRELAELLARHEVPEAALRDFLDLAERKMGEGEAIEGTARALPAA